VEQGGQNYLVPVDADLSDDAYIRARTVEVGYVTAEMEASRNRLNILILDACRNNPYAAQTRSTSRGLATVAGPTGTYIAYSASAGEVAADGTGANSPFAAALVAHLPDRGGDLDAVFNAVRTEVYTQTAKKQTPESRNKVVGPSFYFSPGDTGDSQVEEPEYEVETEVVAPDPGTVTVTVKGGGAVKLDGAAKGTVPAYGTLNLKGVAPGPHTVCVGSECETVDVTPGGVARVELEGAPPAPVAQAPAAPSRGGIEWVSIPGGSFSMGSNEGDSDEKPVHTVRVAGFEMSRTEVTFGQYQACVSAGACTAPHVSDGTCWVEQGGEWKQGPTLPASFQGADQPVVCVDWDQASVFARWAGGRLPTESEWEYAARGGQSYTYAGSNDVGAVAWYDGNSGGQTHAVCGKQRNGYGLCDMSGNVWEWVEDWYHDSYSGAPTDGSAWLSPAGSLRVARGGSWHDPARVVRVAYRSRSGPSGRFDHLGFRLSRD
jgi:formylglycine-generating enzyme required for sulfatase activity